MHTETACQAREMKLLKLQMYNNSRPSVYAILHTLIHTLHVFIKVCNTPHKTEFRRKKPPKFVPLKLEIYLNYAFSLDLCC